MRKNLIIKTAFCVLAITVIFLQKDDPIHARTLQDTNDLFTESANKFSQSKVTYLDHDQIKIESTDELSEEKFDEIRDQMAFSEDPTQSSASDVTQYSYEIIPLLSPFNDFFYVKTDNPDPSYVRFVDKDSVYYTEEDLASDAPCAIRYCTRCYADVVYEEKQTRRVKGGYIFVRDTGYNMDGGDLVLQQADRPYIKEYYDGYTSESCPDYIDTAVHVSCADVRPADQYLVDTYASPSNTFFENLSAIESALTSLSLYPKDLLDTDRPSPTPYPCLATSPYYELFLNEHYETMYERSTEGVLSISMHPFVLHSLSFPGMMSSVAHILEPTCTISYGPVHYLIEVSYNGESRFFGGAGNGTTNDLYSKFIQKVYTFDQSETDYAFHGDLEKMEALYHDYEQHSEQELSVARDLISGNTFIETTKMGTWIKVASEGFGYGKSYTYIYPLSSYNHVASNAWVDGRYISIHEQFYKGVRFGDPFPYAQGTIDTGKSDIILRNVTFRDLYGELVTRDACYSYQADTDDWRAYYSYTGGSWYSEGMILPDELILTREEVNTMHEKGELDKNTDHAPLSGLLYDGTAYPGTPFKTIERLSSKELTFTLAPAQTKQLSIDYSPADATVTALTFTSADQTICSVSKNGLLLAKGPGTTTILCKTTDGSNRELEITVIVKQPLEGIIQDPDGKYRYYIHDILQTNYTGLARKHEDNSLWYVSKGVVDLTVTTLCNYKGKTYYVKRGKVDLKVTDLIRKDQTYWYVKKGIVQGNKTGLVKIRTHYYYIKKGIWKDTFTGILRSDQNYKYIKKGIWQNSFTGLVKDHQKYKYVKKGIWKNKFTGTITYKHKRYKIKKGIMIQKLS